MPRITIDLPARFAFTTEIAIYINHVNYRRHLDNSSLLSLVAEANERFFAHLGYPGMDVEGCGVVYADGAVQFRSEAFHRELLVIELACGDFSRVGCDLVYRVSEKTTGREVARGKTGIVFFDYEARKATAIPPGFLAKVTDDPVAGGVR